MSSDKAATKARIETEEDFIVYPKMGNSIEKLIARYPDGIEDAAIMKCLMLTQDEFESKFEAALEVMREDLGANR
jgi:NADH:ubiquinone oxidoreductase subunit E